MQPELNELSKDTSLNQNTQDSHPTNQYGFRQSDHEANPRPRAGGERAKAKRSSSIASSSTSSGKSSDDSLEFSSRGLRKGSPGDRIAEHERAWTRSSKGKSKGPIFNIIQGVKSPTLNRVVLTDFPNEVLTHVLSHLPPTTLSDVSLVSKRFHHLVTTPHAWRIAFSRYFPGVEALKDMSDNSHLSEESDLLRADRRVFTRLTGLASWRSEYILRTRLLRSLARGKPADEPGVSSSGSSRPGNSSGGNAHITYNSELVTIVDQVHANFGSDSNRKLPRLIHGATDVGMASSSDPRSGKVDSWGFGDAFTPQHFADLYPGDHPYGLGPGDIVGIPNLMDVSQSCGMLYVEGLPNGRVYYRSTEEKRGRELAVPLEQSLPELGIPAIANDEAAMTALWISKRSSIPEQSGGLIGMMVGSSQGVLSSYSLGTNPLRERRLERGELTARWVISPGVPIISIAVDENTNMSRQSQKRLLVVVMNALGEVFYLTDFLTRPDLDRASSLSHVDMEKLAWASGRSVFWNMIKATTRTARSNSYDGAQNLPASSPRTSGDGLGLNRRQIASETEDINDFLKRKPKDFRDLFEGWDMRRLLEVDFAGVGQYGANESVFVISCGLDEGQQSAIKRFTRCVRDKTSDELPDSSMEPQNTALSQTSSTEDTCTSRGRFTSNSPTWSFGTMRSSSTTDLPIKLSTEMLEEWRSSTFSFGDLKSPQITTTAIDSSIFALTATEEDPLLNMSRSSTASSPTASPLKTMPAPAHSSDIPGQRARLLAVGTKTGAIILWNMRTPTATKPDLENEVYPTRVIRTDSPQISCLALTALYLVHGGNDGLVQAWDPLASVIEPIRTLNSRFSSRARRRLVQAEASAAGVGINLFAAGAICLDPDPTVLRGVVSLGSHLRYWSYSSNAVDHYKGNKRRLRRSERGSNQGGDRFSGTGRGALKEYIANEKFELEREKKLKRKEDEKRSLRYGIDLLGPGATEDEILAYATMLSEEAAKDDEQRRKSASEGSSSDTITEQAVISPVSSSQDEADDEIAEAIRLSLQESNGFRASSFGEGDASASNFTVKYTTKKRSSPSRSPPVTSSGAMSSGSRDLRHNADAEMADFELALQLSQVEEETRLTKIDDDSSGQKGKGRARDI